MSIRECKFRFFGVGIVAIVFVCITSYLQQTGHGRLRTTGQKASDPNQGKSAENRCDMLPASLTNCWHDARVVQDVAAFRFNQILKEPNQIWVLMRITPANSSGSGYTKKGGRGVIMIGGSWKLIAALTKAPDQRSGRYRWEEPFDGWPRKISIKDIYTIVRQKQGGSIICRYNPKAKGADQFASICLIPRQWERYVKPALTYLQKNLERLQQKSPQVTNDLRVLLDHKNPFVAVTACNLLAERNGLDQDFARGSLAGAKGYRQAIFTYLLLTYPLRMKHDQWFEEMSRVIKLADNSKQLAGAALGIFASSLNYLSLQVPWHIEEHEAKLKLLERLDKKQLKFGRQTKSDKYIISILEMCQIRQLRTTGHKVSDPNQVKTAEKRSAILPASLTNCWHDARVVHDVAAFRFNQILKEPDQIWVLMRITPDTSSGVFQQRKPFAVTISGSWKLIAALTKAPDRRSGRYGWEEHIDMFARVISIKDLYTIFRHKEGGSIICRYNPKAKGAEQFASVCLIPRQWERHVKPALTYLQKNLERLQQKSPQVTDDLRVLLDHKNPFVAVTACNLLAERNGLDQDFARGYLAGAKGYQQAIFTYVLLIHSLQMKQDQWFEELSRVIEMADNSKQLAGAALSIFASFYSVPVPSRIGREARLKLLERLDKKQLKFGRQTKSDKYIISILERIGIRQKAPGLSKETIEKKSKKKPRKK